MKKSISVFLIFICAIFYSQNSCYTVIYKVTYKPQKELKTEKVEYMALEIKDLKSKFYNLETKRLDSLVAINDNSISDDTEMPNLKFTVYKNLSARKNVVSSSFNQIDFIYVEQPLKYKLVKTKPFKIKNYDIKEAFADFGGRTWIIEYTPDIPIFDGPYVFSGLPGLVYQAISQDLEYVFELESITKNTEMKAISIPKENVRKEFYSKKLLDFKKDPAHQNIVYKNIWGDMMHYKYVGQSLEEIKEQEVLFQKIIGKFNNPIDKDVFLLNF